MLMISPYKFVGIYRESDLAPKAQGKKPIRRKQADLRRIWIIIPIRPLPSSAKCPKCTLTRLNSLVFRATHCCAVAIISALEGKRWQPGLTANSPELIGRGKLINVIQRAEVNFNLIS